MLCCRMTEVQKMNVLIACEESQEVCKAFRERGHRAFSCDIQECSGGHPEWHIQGDALPLLNGNCSFVTSDTHTHTSGRVGSDHRSSPVYRPRSLRGKMVSRKAERLPAAESLCFLHALCAGSLQEDSRREPHRHHVELLQKARPNNPALRIRASCEESNVPLVVRSSKTGTDRDCQHDRRQPRLFHRRCYAVCI